MTQKIKEILLFPNIPRVIPETHILVHWARVFKKQNTWVIFFICMIGTCLVYEGMDLYKNLQQKRVIDANRQEVYDQILYWQGIVKTYPDYRDGYFQLALLAYRLGDLKKTEGYLQKSLELDPNFVQARALEKELSGK